MDPNLNLNISPAGSPSKYRDQQQKTGIQRGREVTVSTSPKNLNSNASRIEAHFQTVRTRGYSESPVSRQRNISSPPPPEKIDSANSTSQVGNNNFKEKLEKTLQAGRQRTDSGVKSENTTQPIVNQKENENIPRLARSYSNLSIEGNRSAKILPSIKGDRDITTPEMIHQRSKRYAVTLNDFKVADYVDKQELTTTSTSASSSCSNSPATISKKSSPTDAFKKMNSKIGNLGNYIRDKFEGFNQEEEEEDFDITRVEVNLIPATPKEEEKLFDNPQNKSEYIINEIFTSEKNFCNQLTLLNKMIKKLKDTEVKELFEILSEADKIRIFSSTWISILGGIKSPDMAPQPVKFLSENFQRLKFESIYDNCSEVYVNFIEFKNSLRANAKSDFENRLNNLLREIDENNNLDFDTLAACMFQRIPRFRLLLIDLLKETQDGELKKELTIVIEKVENLIKKINENLRGTLKI